MDPVRLGQILSVFETDSVLVFEGVGRILSRVSDRSCQRFGQVLSEFVRDSARVWMDQLVSKNCLTQIYLPVIQLVFYKVTINYISLC
jgi:hypothetical protein